MVERSVAPDVSGLEIPMDAWTEPFWAGTAEERLLLPACTNCDHFRWPPGPFCPRCQCQEVAWHDAGAGRIYSFTLVREPVAGASDRLNLHVPALIEFPDAGGVRLLAAIVDAAIEDIQVGAAVSPGWVPAANAVVPVFQVD